MIVMAEKKSGSVAEKSGTVKKTEKKAKKNEKKEVPKPVKIFTIPLKKAFEKTRKKRVPYSVRLVRKFLETHLKTKEIRLGRKLNEHLWERSIQSPPRKVKVGVFKRGAGYDAELEGFAYEDFKPISAKKPEGIADKLASRIGGKALKNQEEEKMAEGRPEIKEERKPDKTPNMESK